MKSVKCGLRYAIGALLLASPVADAQYFRVDIYTAPPSAQRLFMDTAETVPAPIGTTMWFVADMSGDGIAGVQGSSIASKALATIASRSGDDRLFFCDVVDGLALGSQPGLYYRTGISITDDFVADSHIYVFLLNDASGDGVVADHGDTMGMLNLGVQSPPAMGNAEYIIASNIHADQLSVVPEPHAFGVIFGLTGVVCSWYINRKGRDFSSSQKST